MMRSVASKLFDTVIVYCKDKSALKRLDEIRRKAAELFASDRRYEKADQAYSNAKKMLAEAYLAQSLSKARSCAGAAIEFIENAEEMAKARNTVFRSVHIQTREDAQNAPSPFTTFSLFYDGQLVTHEILSEKKFDKVLEDKGV